MKNEWNIVHDCDSENGKPTEWSLKVAEEKFYWIDELADETFDVIDHDAHTVLKNCKTLVSAKRWVATYLLNDRKIKERKREEAWENRKCIESFDCPYYEPYEVHASCGCTFGCGGEWLDEYGTHDLPCIKGGKF